MCPKEYYDISNEIKLLVLQFLGVKNALSFFVLVTSDLGLEEQKWELLFSAVLCRHEKIPISSTDCPSHQHAQVHPSQHPVYKLLPSSFFGICHFVKSLNSMVSCCGTEHLPFRCDLVFLVRLVNFLEWEKTKCDWGGPRTSAGFRALEWE